MRSHFLKFRHLILNTKYIQYIQVKEHKYIIDCFNGAHGAFIVGSGGIKTEKFQVEICKKEDPENYKILENWIQKIE